MKLHYIKRIIKQTHYNKYFLSSSIHIIFISATLLISSCRKFVEVDPPKNLLVGETVFSTNETATSAILNIYSLMSSPGSEVSSFYMGFYSGLSSDELRSYSSTLPIQQVYTNNINAIEANTNSIWNTSYNYIYRANAVLEGCQKSQTLNPSVKQQIISEALFVRAFWHFYLVVSYGDVPLVTSTDYTVNSSSGRTEKNLVFKQIIDDLIASQSGLGDSYIGLDNITTSQERVRPNKAAATALLARVYLFTRNYVEAEKQATKVISQTSQYDLISPENVFLKNSKEAIWQLMVNTPNFINTMDGYGYILVNKPSTDIIASSTISSGLLAAFETSDKRMVNWIGRYTDISVVPNIDYYFPYKYKVRTGSNVSEYSMVLRLAEQYLIRAEARAEQGNRTGSIEDLDKIRERAGLKLISETNPDLSKDDLLAAVLKERRVELFTEWGHRWYDLKRTGKIDDVMTVVAPEKGGTWNTNKQLWPIPQPDILNNSKITQNPGYN